MATLRHFFQNLLIPTALCLATGCSLDNSSNSRSSLTLTLPHSFNASEKGQADLQALSRQSCFAVSITGADLTKNSASGCDPAYGVFAGLAAPGETLSIEVSKGSNRNVNIYYVTSEQGCQDFDISQGLGKTFGSNRVYRIGHLTNIEMNKANVNLKVPVQLPNINNSLAALNSSFPASCKIGSASPTAYQNIRASQGSGTYAVPSTGHKMKLRITDKSLDLSAPSGPHRILPIGVDL